MNCKKGISCQNRGAPDRVAVHGDDTNHANNGDANGVNARDEVEAVVGRQEVDRPEQEEGVAQESRFWQRWSMQEAEQWADNTYKEIVAFSPASLFPPPKCDATKKVIEEKIRLITAYTNSSPIAHFALKTLAIIPHLMFQRTHKNSKRSQDVKAVERRVKLWKRGEVVELLNEAKALQKRLGQKNRKRGHEGDKARKFADKMRQGKVAAAIRSLATDGEGAGVLPLNEATRESLKEKHPNARQAPPESKFPGQYQPPHPVIFERITGDVIWKHALHTQGAAGPSGLDAASWKTILSCHIFGNVANDLKDAVATLAKKMATEECEHLEAITSCRLIPLDKKPGCRPIGIGEVIRRIIGKSIMDVVKEDVKKAVGNLQVCAGQFAGCEAAIHSVREIYNDPECEAVLMVDAANAFNNINREATLHNIKVKCPSFAQYVENMYKEPASLFVSNGIQRGSNEMEVILSSEGTTQGDPVAMAMYALGLLNLQQNIKYDETRVKQVAYADDLTGAGKIEDLRKWWDTVIEHGPKVGYFPNANKSVIIVKPNLLEQAQEAFINTSIKITKEGERHLGAVLGTESFKEKYVKDAVATWVKETDLLAQFAVTEPQAAYTAFTFGMKHKWNYLMRTVPNIGPLLEPLEEVINGRFIPAISNGHFPSERERRLVALPPRMGGLGIPNPQELAHVEFQNSARLTASLTENIIAQDEQREVNDADIRVIRSDIAKNRELRQKSELQNIMELLPDHTQKKVAMTHEVGASNWLTALPIRAKGFSLNKKEFTDAIALRYGWPLDGLPMQCTCGTPFNANHAMVCKKGGFVCMRHDEVRDLTTQMLREVCRDVTVEPQLLPLEGERLTYRTSNAANDARVDVSARGFWTRGQRAYFDIRIFDPSARCYQELSLEASHRRNEQEKRRKYEERIQNIDHGSFTPLVFTTSGGMGPAAAAFYARLAEVMAEKKQQPRSSVVAWMRCRLSFSLLRSALLCLRGTKTTAPRPRADIDFEAAVVDSRINEKLD